MFEDLIWKGCAIKEGWMVRNIWIIDKIEDVWTYKVYTFSSNWNDHTYVSKINWINHQDQTRNENRSCEIVELTSKQKEDISKRILSSLEDIEVKRLSTIRKLNYPALK